MSKFYLCLSLGLVLFLGCQKKEGDESAQLSDQSGEEIVHKDAIEPADLGIATRLPKSVEFYAAIHHPDEVVKAVLRSEAAEILFTLEESGDAEEKSGRPDKKKLDDAMAKVDEMMAENVFFCIDRGLAKNISTMGGLYQDMNAAQAKLLAKLLSRLLKMENPLLAGEDELMQKFIEDAFSGFAGMKETIENGEDVFEIPNVYLGCLPPAGKKDEWHKMWLSSVSEMADKQEDIQKLEFEKYGIQFQGVRLELGKLFSEAAEAGGKEIEAELGDDVDGLLDDGAQGALADESKEWFDLLSERLKKLTMVIVLGEVDGHLVMFIGENADALVLVDQVEKSLAGNPNFAQLGQDGGKVMGAWYASDDLLKAFQTWRGYEKTYRALATAFKEEKLPNSDEIVRHFEALAGLELGLLDCRIDDYLMLCVWDQGVRFDSVGGREDLDLDFSKPLQLPAVADAVQDDYFIRAHWRSDQQRQAQRMDYGEHLVGVAGQVIEGGYLAFLERDESGAEWYEEGKKMYEQIVAPEVARLWGGYRKFSHQALDGEVAVLMDLNGGMPRVPAVPNIYIEEGKVPRLMIARPVSDRAALSSAYEDFETTAKNVLEYTSVLTETELPMPDFLSADKGGLKTWFYPFPMMTDDFVPGVSVSDSLLMFGTSKNWAEQTYICWEQRNDVSSGDNRLYGSVLDIQFKPLWDVASHWLDLAEKESMREKNETDKPGKEDKLKSSEEVVSTAKDSTEEESPDSEPKLVEDDLMDYDQARRLLENARSMKSIRWHRRKEQGKTRSTLEFKMDS